MVGRTTEKTRLLKYAESDESEFVAVNGRRRVGKTYLIRQTFQDRFAFQHTGVARGRTKEQLNAFGLRSNGSVFSMYARSRRLSASLASFPTTVPGRFRGLRNTMVPRSISSLTEKTASSISAK